MGTGVANVARLATVEEDILLEAPCSLFWSEVDGAELHWLGIGARGS